MAFTRRDPSDARIAHDAGGIAGVGLLSSRRRRDRVEGRICGHCDAEARVDMVDMARSSAYLTCLSCGNEWETARLHVLRHTTRR